MKSLRGVAILVVAFSFISYICPASAQPISQDNEVQVSAGFFHAQGGDSGNLNADLSYGRYLEGAAFQVGLRGAYLGTFNENASDAWTVSLAPFIDYHFLNVYEHNRVIPFIGAFIGGVFNDSEFDGEAGPQGGIKFFFDDQTFVALRYRYEWFFDKLDIGTENSEGNHVVSFGLGYIWGGAGR